MKNILVTGANKGIGYSIIKLLLKQKDASNFHILLGARSEANAKQAVENLQKDGYDVKNVEPFLIDLDDNKSIQAAAERFKEKFGGLDVLINNAGMAFKGSRFDEEVARVTMGTNYFGTQSVCHAFFPLLNENARVSTVSSMMGQMTLNNMSSEVRKRFMADDITEQQLDDLVNEFIECAKDGSAESKGWPKSAYGVSKSAVTILTRIQARENKKKGVKINSCCPGWCKTDMAGPNAPLTADDGAVTPVKLALLPDDAPTGLFWREEKVAAFH